MLTQVEIERAGERIVAQWLSEKGYHTNIDMMLPGLTDIKAHGPASNLLIQVDSAVHPFVPFPLVCDEENDFKSRASRSGYVPWEARVQLDNELRIIGKIKWRRLIE